MVGKRNGIALFARRLGLIRLMETLPKRGALVVLNYHRIGNRHTTPYNETIFSATAEEFDGQVQYLKRTCSVLSLEESLECLAKKPARPQRRPAVLITFDDGYLDNYELAFPILRSHGVPATFFLIASYIGRSGPLPFWDSISYLVKRTACRKIRLTYPGEREWDISSGPTRAVVKQITAVYQSLDGDGQSRFLAGLSQACELALPDERIFMNWEEAARMAAGGMDIGSHTNTHPLLASLTIEQQYQEFRDARAAIEAKLSRRCDVVAYPFGMRESFSQATTYPALERAGYRAAFSFFGGINRVGEIPKYNILRNAPDIDTPIARFRLQVTGAALSGRYWI